MERLDGGFEVVRSVFFRVSGTHGCGQRFDFRIARSAAAAAAAAAGAAAAAAAAGAAVLKKKRSKIRERPSRGYLLPTGVDKFHKLFAVESFNRILCFFHDRQYVLLCKQTNTTENQQYFTNHAFINK